ncbi:MAG: DUF4405 domain-containing protein [Bacteroidales bacterium]|jgi:hypothetical protein|nr:DUF4405 domain-containing protein [Bacteroidales bacterium]
MENWSKIKPKINLVIDTIMFLDLMAVAGLGFLMKYILLPGYKVNEIYGTDAELFFWGLDRHQWGGIHLYLALFGVFLLMWHIILHWTSIVSIFRQIVKVGTARIIIASIVGILSLIFALSPFFVNPEIALVQRKHNRNRVPERYGTNTDSINNKSYNDASLPDNLTAPQETDSADKSATNPLEVIKEENADPHLHHNQVNIDGTMTLSEISARYKISIDDLAGAINVPASYANERLGRLKKRYGFEMDDLRVFVISKTEKNDK